MCSHFDIYHLPLLHFCPRQAESLASQPYYAQAFHACRVPVCGGRRVLKAVLLQVVHPTRRKAIHLELGLAATVRRGQFMVLSSGASCALVRNGEWRATGGRREVT